MFMLNLSVRNKPAVTTVNYHLGHFIVSTGSALIIGFTNSLYFRLYSQLWNSIKTRKWHIELTESMSISKSSHHLSTGKSHLAVEGEENILAKEENTGSSQQNAAKGFKPHDKKLLQSLKRQAKVHLRNDLRLLKSMASVDEVTDGHNDGSVGCRQNGDLTECVQGEPCDNATGMLPVDSSDDQLNAFMAKVNLVDNKTASIEASIPRFLENIHGLFPRKEPSLDQSPARQIKHGKGKKILREYNIKVL